MAQLSSSVRIEPRPHSAATQATRMSPATIQGLEMLSLPATSLNAYLRDMVERNPLLDMKDEGEFLELGELPLEENDPEEWDFSLEERKPLASRFRTEAFDIERIKDVCTQTETLGCHLRTQLTTDKRQNVCMQLVDAILDYLDDRGYFDGSLSVLCDETGHTLEEAEEALRVVQSLHPRGIGARDLRECLLLQLEDVAPEADLLHRMVTESLDDLACNRTTKLRRAYRLSIDELAYARSVIASLEPHPGAAFSQKKDTVYIIPDLIVTRSNSDFILRVNGEFAERLVLSDEYDNFVTSEGDRQAITWLAEKKREADIALANVNQRKRTLFRFGMYLLKAQRGFFCEGITGMQPLTMQQAADELELHVSTVSRIVLDKHILTPWGLYPLKKFFCSALPCAESGASLSSVSIKELIREMIEAEDLRAPLSDADVTQALNEQGIDIKRRTVAKYRDALQIPCQSLRRR